MSTHKETEKQNASRRHEVYQKNQGVTRIILNDQIREELQIGSVLYLIQERQLRWFGNL